MIGHYTGRYVRAEDEPDACGDYVLSVLHGTEHLVLNAQRWGAYMKYANCAPTREAANAAFVKKFNDRFHMYRDGRGIWHVPVIAVRDICAHEEILLWYGDSFVLE